MGRTQTSSNQIYFYQNALLLIKINLSKARKENNCNSNNKSVYSIHAFNSYKDNYQEDFIKGYNWESAIEINNIETDNNYNKLTQEINNKIFMIWILDSGALISTTNDLDLSTSKSAT